MKLERILLPQTDAELALCFPAFHVLRPHILADTFVTQVREQQNHGYQIVAFEHDGLIQSAAGFRITHFLAWGKVLYIDDLTTLPEARGQGYATRLLDWLTSHAKANNCAAIHLDTGYARHAAHRVYLNHGFKLNCHHMAKSLT
jgi:GNAT superfamily N-acetyltransferase